MLCVDWPKASIVLRGCCGTFVLLACIALTALAKPVASLKPPYEPTAVQRASLFKTLRWSADCESDYQFLQSSSETFRNSAGITAYPLADGSTLYTVQCSLGAYLPNHEIIHLLPKALPADRAKALHFAFDPPKPVKRTPSDTYQELTGHLDFNPATQTLTLLSLSRGLGGCGDLLTWRFVPANRTMRLIQKRSQTCDAVDARIEKHCGKMPPSDACDIDALIDPKHWPRVWSSPVK